MKYRAFLFLMVCIAAFSRAESFESITQDLKKDINYLSSEVCFGRGISHHGIYKAENYISKELKQAGLDVSKQAVRYKMNIPLGSPLLVINKDTLDLAYDYIPHPYTPSVNTMYKSEDVVVLGHDDLDALKDSLQLVSVSAARRHLLENTPSSIKGKLILFEEDRTLISRQNKKYKQVAFQVVKDRIPDDIAFVYAKHRTSYRSVVTRNIIGMIKGTSMPDSTICISAHYDHMGAWGNVYYPGANDNASGVAVLLSLARYYSKNPPAMTLIFCFFTGEEQGLYGSQRYVQKPLVPLKQNIMTLNLDMVGSGHDGWGVVAGKEYPLEAAIFQGIAEHNDLGKLKLRDNAKNSDHFPFIEAGSKALFFYASGGKQAYHHPEDIAETLDWDVMENMISMIKDYIQAKETIRAFPKK